MFKAVAAFIFVVAMCMLAIWIMVIGFAVKTSDQIEAKGLKAVVEQVWCGPEKKCL